MSTPRPHLLGIDDGPFEKDQLAPVPLVAVTMEGASLLESIAVSSFPVDGDDVTRFLADWIATLRTRPCLDAVVIGGITIAGLGVVDITALAARTALPVIAITRREPTDGPLLNALEAAGLPDRRHIVTASPPSVRLEVGLYMTYAGTTTEHATSLVRAAQAKARVPEPLRVAHLIAQAVSLGESRGRV